MDNLEQLALKRDAALRAYTSVIKANRRAGTLDLGALITASNASTSAHMAWSNAYDLLGDSYSDEIEYSDCCYGDT